MECPCTRAPFECLGARVLVNVCNACRVRSQQRISHTLRAQPRSGIHWPSLSLLTKDVKLGTGPKRPRECKSVGDPPSPTPCWVSGVLFRTAFREAACFEQINWRVSPGQRKRFMSQSLRITALCRFTTTTAASAGSTVLLFAGALLSPMSWSLRYRQ